MPSFSTVNVRYHENRTDGGFAWDPAYDLSWFSNIVNVSIRVKLVGDNPGSTKTVWANGVNSIWNQRVFFSDNNRLYEVKLHFSFVNSGEHHVVNVHNALGRDDVSNWYLQTDWGPSYQDRLAAHEVGHMFGNYDEYAGGATHNNFTRTGALMADLTLAGFQDYFWTVEFYTERYGHTTLSTVLARRGTSGNDTLSGTSGLDGFYGFGGADRILGNAGNDYIDGGSGNDRLYGGDGDDIIFGGSGNDVIDGGFGFDTMDGGSGSDTADYRFYNGTTALNLSTGRVSFPGNSTRIDTLKSFESARTGNAGDVLTGNGKGNHLWGNGGNDVIKGLGGNDTLSGGSGRDTLVGGPGRDVLSGGPSADIYDFNAVKESRVGSNRDVISNFTRGSDHIDLRTIDAKTGSGNQGFSWINKQSFHHKKGELHYKDLGSQVMVEGDVNGDGRPDFQILVKVGSIGSHDFYL